MTSKHAAAALLIVAAALGLTGATHNAGDRVCLRQQYDLRATMELNSDRLELIFRNEGQDSTPAFGYQLRVYRYVTTQKSWSSTFITINPQGLEDPGWNQIKRLPCGYIRGHAFELERLCSGGYRNARVKFTIHYDRILRDANLADHNIEYVVTL